LLCLPQPLLSLQEIQAKPKIEREVPDPSIRHGTLSTGQQGSVAAASQHGLWRPVERKQRRPDFSPVGCAIPVSSRHAQRT
jgi:hypothetical protein